LEKQVSFLDKHPECAMVGTWAEIWEERSRTQRLHRHPADNSTLQFELLFDNPFVHSSVMLRKSALEYIGGYSTDPNRQPPEDYELWSRIAHEFQVANLPEALHIYRERVGSMSRKGPAPFLDHLVSISAENIAWAAGLPATTPSAINLAALAHYAFHRIQGEPDFLLMRNILMKAVSHVIPTDEEIIFKKKANLKLDLFESRFEEFRYGGKRKGRLKNLARRIIRKLYD
jgi:hypothetical protein